MNRTLLALLAMASPALAASNAVFTRPDDPKTAYVQDFGAKGGDKTDDTAALVSIAAAAMSEPKEEAPCLRASQVDDFKGLPGGRSLIVTDSFRKKFKITLQSQCNNLQSDPTLVFKARAPGRLACLTRGDTLLSNSYGGPPDRCTIQKIELYSPEEGHSDSAAGPKN
jgi:hypothetical protein